MSLFKQVSIVLIFIFLILFTLIIGLSFNIIKDSTIQSLYENVQNSVTNLSLSITNAEGDESTIKTAINASFDNGNYEKIVFKDMDDKVVYDLKKDLVIDNDEIPAWFIKLVNIDEISALATVSNGWNVLGVLEIYADRAIFYHQTYAMFTKLIVSILISFAILLVILFLLFTFILRPLRMIDKQAKAVMNNEFIVSNNIPFTTEFKILTLSINSMINKFEGIFKNTNNVLKLNKELLYLDEITKLNNRKYLLLKVDEYLEKESTNNEGFVVIIALKIDIINKTYGYKKTNDILFNFASILKKEFDNDFNVVARVNGSEFVALVPNIMEENIKELLDDAIKEIKGIEELKDNISFALCKYMNQDSTRTLFTKMDYAISQAKVHTENDYFYAKNIENYKTKEEWINILNISLKEEHFKLLHRDILNINSKENFLKTVSFELEYQGEIIRYGEFIAPVLEQNRLDEVYLHIIEKVLKTKEDNLVSIQLPIMFIEKLSSYAKLKELLVKYKNQNIIFEIEEEAFNKNLNSTLMYVELFKENNLKFAIFNFIANSNDYSYIKELKPMYIKASKHFLLESKQSLNMLKILTQSLDIKLVATSVDDVSELTSLGEIGIDAVSGSVMSKLKK